MYDAIRIVDPINKNLIIIKDNEIIKIKGTCYDYWKRWLACNNCISMRAYNEKDTIVKIEYVDNKVILLVASPVFIDGRMYVLETLKDISKNGRIFDFNTNSDVNICAMINEMNEKIVSDELTGVYNRKYIDERLQIDINADKNIDNELSILNSRIEEVRDVLNEMCISSDETVEDKQKLNMSQYLDELIVEYMKNINKK
jgi:two-component system, cell cycle response regulator